MKNNYEAKQKYGIELQNNLTVPLVYQVSLKTDEILSILKVS